MANKPILYTIGYQPIDFVDVNMTIIDLINLVTSEKPPEEIKRLSSAIIDFIQENQKSIFENYVLVNTRTNSMFIPYLISRKSVLYDPPYNAGVQQVAYLFDQIQKIIGVTVRMNGEELRSPTAGTMSNSLNRTRDILFQNRAYMSPGDYFNSLLLLSDLHNSNPAKLQNYILQSQYKYDPIKSYKKVIYFGDPVNPEFFNTLLDNGYIVSHYLPYDQFVNPADDIAAYYAQNFMYQSPTYKALTLRGLITDEDFVILNPGSIYLTREESEFYMRTMQNDIKFKVIQSYNPTLGDLKL